MTAINEESNFVSDVKDYQQITSTEYFSGAFTKATYPALKRIKAKTIKNKIYLRTFYPFCYFCGYIPEIKKLKRRAVTILQIITLWNKTNKFACIDCYKCIISGLKTYQENNPNWRPPISTSGNTH